MSTMADHFEDEWVECWQCSGVGLVAGCFEDCCSGADCDPDDAELCCSPSRCDVCKGTGGWYPDEQEKPAAQGQSDTAGHGGNDNR